MKTLAAIFFIALTLPALGASSTKLAPPSKVQLMLGEVLVIAATDEKSCAVYLYEDRVKNGYRIEVDEPCSAVFPVLTKAKAWRVYGNGEMTFADSKGKDLVRFRGKEYTYFAVEKVDGIVKLSSSQEVNE